MPSVDRTTEFLDIAQKVRRRRNIAEAPPPTKAERSQFYTCASEIGRTIFLTSENLNKLTKLAKRKSLFDDKAEEIRSLSNSITESLSDMQERLAQLDSIRSQQRSRKPQADQHTTNIVNSLRGKLHSTSETFKVALKQHASNLKGQEERRLTFSSPSAGQHQALAGGLSQASQQQSMVMHNQSTAFLEDRANMVEQVESHVVELGQIFHQLADIVREQEDMLGRIDDNVQDTMVNVTGAHEQFLQYYRNISSNRKLVVRMFAVLLFFIVMFGFWM